MTPLSSTSTTVIVHAHNGSFYCRGRVKRMATIDLLDEVLFSPSMLVPLVLIDAHWRRTLGKVPESLQPSCNLTNFSASPQLLVFLFRGDVVVIIGGYHAITGVLDWVRVDSSQQVQISQASGLRVNEIDAVSARKLAREAVNAPRMSSRYRSTPASWSACAAARQGVDVALLRCLEAEESISSVVHLAASNAPVFQIIDTYARPDGGLDSTRRDPLAIALVPVSAPTFARGFSLFLGLRKALTFEPSLRLTGSCIGEPCSNVATTVCHGGYGPGSQDWDGAGMMGERRLTLSPGIAPDKTRGRRQVYNAAALETSTPSAHGGSIRGVSTKIDGYVDKFSISGLGSATDTGGKSSVEWTEGSI
ncbi:hypothetical protein EV421DRAFT_1961393 [Armillaria borealis]|uniref:Uncharacterized protein n=1 Tax=Armillaria borealis TaxID=47425 RepID=A0AA39JDE6_9AGAR|nr:hypothetical protein EV421DRAFT_1961393 [Armillaria borealis]